MRDRISQAEIDSFANAAMELWRETEYPYVSMHDVVSHVWAPGIKLPPAATKDYHRKIGAVRKHLITVKGCTVATVVADYPRKIKAGVFAEEDAAQCLPGKGKGRPQQAGFLFIEADSAQRDLMIWAEWLRNERKVSTARGSEAAESIVNAERKGLTSRVEVQPVLAIEVGESAQVPA